MLFLLRVMSKPQRTNRLFKPSSGWRELTITTSLWQPCPWPWLNIWMSLKNTETVASLLSLLVSTLQKVSRLHDNILWSAMRKRTINFRTFYSLPLACCTYVCSESCNLLYVCPYTDTVMHTDSYIRRKQVGYCHDKNDFILVTVIPNWSFFS